MAASKQGPTAGEALEELTYMGTGAGIGFFTYLAIIPGVLPAVALAVLFALPFLVAGAAIALVVGLPLLVAYTVRGGWRRVRGVTRPRAA